MRYGEAAGSRSKRRATLQGIAGKGEPLMESRLIVDESEIDANGFLTGRASDDSDPIHELWAEIRSLESRANSRDREALTLHEADHRERMQTLRAESRDLRNQAAGLRVKLYATRADPPGR
jgi:hypothetical protein